MSRVAALSGLVPPELFVLLVTAAGFAFIVGARAIGTMLITTVVVGAFLPVVLDPLLAMLPLWLLIVVGIAGLLSLLHLLLAIVTSQGAADHAVGHLMDRGIMALLRLPFRVIGWIARILWALVRPGHRR